MNAPRSTQAKSMHFATLFPGWNSLDSVRRTHSDLEAAALVFFALLVLFDILAHLSTDNKKKTLLEKIGLGCFAIAVLAEVVAYPYGQRNDTLSERMIRSLDTEAREAGNNASAALVNSGTALAQSKEAETKSGDAIDKARKAQESLGNAENEANKAQRASSNALTISKDANQIAHDARQEADSFEKDIAQATEELNRLKASRSLTRESEMVSALRPFKGTEYFFASVFADDDSIKLLQKLDGVLQQAEWKRVGFPGPFPYETFNLFGNTGGSTPAGVSTGIQVSVDSGESVRSLQALPLDKLPPLVRAAVVLNTTVSSHLFPPQADTKVAIQPGPSKAVHITVGKKP